MVYFISKLSQNRRVTLGSLGGFRREASSPGSSEFRSRHVTQPGTPNPEYHYYRGAYTLFLHVVLVGYMDEDGTGTGNSTLPVQYY
jgi:hypothetical protein